MAWAIAILATLLILVVFLGVVGAFLWRPIKIHSRESQLARARKFFHIQRERLEAKFVSLTSNRAQTELPRWSDCTFSDDVSFVRNRSTGELSAFVAVNVPVAPPRSAATPTEGAVGNLQIGTAVFRFDRDHWVTDGRAILNLSPSEAIQFFQNDVEMVDEELAHRF
jgi:hypothetical protein